MISYESAKELADAGFPQRGNGSWVGSPAKLLWRSKDRVYAPTLEELIDGCGDDFSNLHTLRDDEWRAEAIVRYGNELRGVIRTGKSPEDAIARVWLALNTLRNL